MNQLDAKTRKLIVACLVTRLTNGFSKKLENHEHAVALHFMHYNFCRPHMSLGRKGQKVTPAMAAGVSDHVWTLDELVDLLPKAQGKRVRIGETGLRAS